MPISRANCRRPRGRWDRLAARIPFRPWCPVIASYRPTVWAASPITPTAISWPPSVGCCGTKDGWPIRCSERGRRRAARRLLRSALAGGRSGEEHARSLPARSAFVRRMVGAHRTWIAGGERRGFARLPRRPACRSAAAASQHAGARVVELQAVLPLRLARAAHQRRSDAQARPSEKTLAFPQILERSEERRVG